MYNDPNAINVAGIEVEIVTLSDVLKPPDVSPEAAIVCSDKTVETCEFEFVVR
jgi:hypothetical protein